MEVWTRSEKKSLPIAAISKAAEHSPLFEIALVLVRLDHVDGGIVNANHCIV
jgi:hypothetical protein